MTRKLHDREHELALLNCIYIDRSIIPNVSRVIRQTDFADQFHQLVYQKIKELDSKGGADFITLNTETGSVNPLFIATLCDHVPSSANWEYYAKSVKMYSVLRNAQAMAQNILDASAETIEKEMNDFMAKGTELLDMSGGNAVKHVREVIPALIKKIEYAYNNKGCLPGIPTGFSSLDRILDGFQNDFIVLGARPSMGKTALAISCAEKIVSAGKTVGFISAEMPDDKILLRMLAGKSGIDSRSIKSGRLKQQHFDKIQEAFSNIYDYKMWIDDSSIKLNEVVSSCRIMRRVKKCDIIFIDHAGMIVCEGDGVAEKGNNISKTIKRLQRELGIPIILLSQLKRDAEGKEPTLSDIKNSGSFEEDADVAMFLHRERQKTDGSENAEEDTTQEAKVIVLKNRDGEIADAEILFITRLAKFVDKAESRYENHGGTQ